MNLLLKTVNKNHAVLFCIVNIKLYIKAHLLL